MYYDDSVNVPTQISHTCDHLFKLSDKFNCDVSSVFEHIAFYKLLADIKLHKLTPWILLNSSKFLTKFMDYNEEQQRIIEILIDFSIWDTKFKCELHNQDLAKSCIKTLQL
jgi:hypothetical protein